MGFCMLAGIMLSGCLEGSKKITITQYPSFYTPDLKSILVVPFENAAPDKSAGAAISDKFANALMANQTYQVFSRNDLKMLTDQADINTAASGTDSLAAVLRSRGKVQAIITGTVTAYGVSRQMKTKQQPVYGAGGRISHYVPVQEQYFEATVEATARLVRVSDGTAIHATQKAVGSASTAGAAGGGGDPMTGALSSIKSLVGGGGSKENKHANDAGGCLAQAADAAVQRLLEEFAVVRKQISVKKDAFAVSTEYYDGKWVAPKAVPMSAKQAFVVVNLPRECDRNSFVVKIQRADARDVLFEQAFIWQAQWSGTPRGQVHAFEPAAIAAKGGGPGAYVAKLYSGDVPAMEAGFKIAP
jgi:hypothetical protein